MISFAVSHEDLLWMQEGKRRRLIFARLVLPNGVGTPAIGVEIAAEVAPLLIGAPIKAHFDPVRITEPVERQDELAERLAAPFYLRHPTIYDILIRNIKMKDGI